MSACVAGHVDEPLFEQPSNPTGGTGGGQASGGSGNPTAGSGGSVSSGGGTSTGGTNNGTGGDVGSGGTSPGTGGTSSDGGTGNVGSGGANSSGGSGGSGGSGTGGTGGSSPVSQAKIRTVVYLPDYRGALSTWAKRLDFARITHVNVCFAKVDGAGNFSYGDTGLKQFADAAHAAKVKVGIAFGGATTINDPGVFASLLTEQNRGAFIDKILGFLEANGLDGVDVDLEGNAVDGKFAGFAQALQAKLSSRGKFTTAAAAKWFAEKGGVGAQSYKAFDFVNIMAYDLCWWGTPTACDIDSLQAASNELNWWVSSGLPKEKAVLGVPFYGRRWGKGDQGYALTYAEIRSKYGSAASTDVFWSGDQEIHHNTLATIQKKARIAKDNGGIMIWEIGQDASGAASLLKGIDDAL